MTPPSALFPHCGKKFSTLWKISRPRRDRSLNVGHWIWDIGHWILHLPRPCPLLPALLLLPLAAAPLRAALPAPPALPFPLPAAPDLRIRQTTTLTTPDQFVHVVHLSRPLAPYELDELSATLERLRWLPQIADPERALAALRHLQALAPTPELRQPFDATLQLIQEGTTSWTLSPIQLVYSPGEPPSLILSFPLPPADLPASPGGFTADLPLPLHDARFSQAVLQSGDGQLTRMETWLSHAPPDLFLAQAESSLVAAGWTPPAAATPPPVQSPTHEASRTRLLAMEAILKSSFRVYHRGSCQLTLFRAPSGSSDPAAPPHAYTFLHRTLLQWPLPPPQGTP